MGSGPMSFVDQQTVVRVLREISLLLQIKGENAFKTRAYDLGADRILAVDDLAERVVQGRLRELCPVSVRRSPRRSPSC